MANRERGLFKIIFKSFVASFKPTPRPRLIGEDYNGTKYYEQEKRQDGSHKRNHRYFTPINEENHEQDIPAEWESWLRYRRREPPTVEEVNKNYEIMMTTKKNASLLKQARTEGNYEEIKQIPMEGHKSEHFPSYDEYKDAGQNYKLKTK